MCSFAGAAVLREYNPAKSEVRKFTYIPGEGLRITYQARAASEAHRPGNLYWEEEDRPDIIPTVLTANASDS